MASPEELRGPNGDRISRFVSFIGSYFGDEVARSRISRTGELDFSSLPIHRPCTPVPYAACSQCEFRAKEYLRNLPFWRGEITRTIPVMIIAQDAGKKPLAGDDPEGFIASVFSLHILASKDRDKYCQVHQPHHKKILDLFEYILGDNFLERCYFTDMIKCAYSTDSSKDFRRCECKNSITLEIELVRPRIIILWGVVAEDCFTKIFTGYREDSVPNVHQPPVSFAFRKYVSEMNEPVAFYVPQVNGNIHGTFDEWNRKLLKGQIDEHLPKVVPTLEPDSPGVAEAESGGTGTAESDCSREVHETTSPPAMAASADKGRQMTADELEAILRSPEFQEYLEKMIAYWGHWKQEKAIVDLLAKFLERQRPGRAILFENKHRDLVVNQTHLEFKYHFDCDMEKLEQELTRYGDRPLSAMWDDVQAGKFNKNWPVMPQIYDDMCLRHPDIFVWIICARDLSNVPADALKYICWSAHQRRWNATHQHSDPANLNPADLLLRKVSEERPCSIRSCEVLARGATLHVATDHCGPSSAALSFVTFPSVYHFRICDFSNTETLPRAEQTVPPVNPGPSAVPTRQGVEASMNATAERLLAFAAGLMDEQWTTIGGRMPFTYRITGEGIEFINPTKTGKPHPASRAEVAAFCAEFKRKRSCRPGDYPGIGHAENWYKSQLLAPIHRFLQQSSGRA